MNRNDFRIEICANSLRSCLAAQEGGADRVELCAGIPEGGTTPSAGEILAAREKLDIKLNVIIRPRGGDFLYSGLEFEIMKRDIVFCREAGVDGLVFGILDDEAGIDMKRMETLVGLADGIPVTFHRAFDQTSDPVKSLEDIISLGCSLVLTSGQQRKACDGIPLIKKLVEISDGRIGIMAGCGIDKDNVREIAERTGVKDFHFSAREVFDSRMKIRNTVVRMGADNDEFKVAYTTAEKVREVIGRLL